MAPNIVGRPLDSLSVAERWRLAGSWVALELYNPDRLPLRAIKAAGKSALECAQFLRTRGLDPANFEYQLLAQPYEQF